MDVQPDPRRRAGAGGGLAGLCAACGRDRRAERGPRCAVGSRANPEPGLPGPEGWIASGASGGLACTARAISYRVNSGQASQVRDQMEQTAFTWTVVAPGLEDYLVHQLHVDGPDGRRLRVFDTPAHQSVRYLIADVAEQYGPGFPCTLRLAVANQVDSDGHDRPLDDDETLHMAGIRDGDRVRVTCQDAAALGRHEGHAFISYVREDAAKVDRLQAALEAAGVRVWRDTSDLMPGEDWRANIRHAITDDALVFITCFSRNSLARSRSYQSEELVLAVQEMRRRRPDKPFLIPVRFDDCEIPDWDIGAGRTLASIQGADLFGEAAERNLVRLTKAVRQTLAHA